MESGRWRNTFGVFGKLDMILCEIERIHCYRFSHRGRCPTRCYAQVEVSGEKGVSTSNDNA